ncbi:serine protease inhibitor ecotin [Oscillatoria amoena NRMC-F 0135]|nr:serine protease inhibitor ecotin [Oscillatoria amoena NRMC-F 0135]MDL5053491.1 serine protease inhibitor ecotin [Oscillatoria laete-virens NRMC-F 0139]
MKLLLLSLLMAVIAPATASAQEDKDPMKAFPEAQAGMTRHVLKLPAQKNEGDYRVELIIGKTVETDAANRYFFGGKLEEKTVRGWGYNYYTLDQLGPMAGTLMGVDPKAPKVKRFITLGGQPELLRYNSKLPLVVYVPEDVEVRYRIWSAPSSTRPVPKG